MPASRLEQRVPQLRASVHERLGAGVVARRAALDEVARQRERRAGEADQRGRPSSATSVRDRLGDVVDVVGLEGPQPLEVGGIVGSVRPPPARRRRRCRCPARWPPAAATMSENRMAASTPCRRTGCRVISVTSSGVRQASSIAEPARSARYSGSERPAWRMNQTGGSGAGPAQRGAHQQRLVGRGGEGFGAGHHRPSSHGCSARLTPIVGAACHGDDVLRTKADRPRGRGAAHGRRSRDAVLPDVQA